MHGIFLYFRTFYFNNLIINVICEFMLVFSFFFNQQSGKLLVNLKL
jgi:hypothetical protein